MDLENELRQAMAEHVTEVSASRTLAHEARRRHRRTVRRRTALATTAAGIVVAIALVPTYRAFHPQVVGSDVPGSSHHTNRPTGRPPATPSRAVPPPEPTPAPSVSGSRRPVTPAPRPHGTHGSGSALPKRLLGYLPPGIDPGSTCRTQAAGARETTTCRWTGSGGWIEVRLVRDRGLTGPADMGFAPPTPSHATVHGHPALRGGGPALPGQVMWIERPGLGVWVGVSASLDGRLTEIAEGVHVT